MNRNTFNNKHETSNTQEPNYKLRRAVAGVALTGTVAVMGIGAYEIGKDLPDSTSAESTTNIEDVVDPNILEATDIINDGENIVSVGTKLAAELTGETPNDIQQPFTARVLQESAADTIPNITHAGDTVTVRYDPSSEQFDVDVTVNPEHIN